MSKATIEPGLPGKKIVTSFLLLLILIGSIISSALLLELTISPQQAWANHLPPPTLLAPTNNAVITVNKPDFDWSDVSGVPGNQGSGYTVQVDDNSDFSSVTYSNTVSKSEDKNAGPGGGFADGTYFWRVASKGTGSDTLGTFSNAFSFRIDTINPDTSITSATVPSGGSGTSISSSGSTSFNSIRFTFSGSDTGGLHPTTPFECKLDAAAFTSAACSSPKDITSLSAGSHTFQVRAVDAAGHIDS